MELFEATLICSLVSKLKQYVDCSYLTLHLMCDKLSCHRLMLKLQRCFSTSIRRNGMAYIGREPVSLPPTVQVTRLSYSIQVQGPLGKTEIPVFPFIRLSQIEASEMANNLPAISISVEDAAIKEQRQMWGTTRTLVANAVQGMLEGFRVPVHLVGVGYRAAIEDDPRPSPTSSGKRLNLKLGFSHSIFMPIPKGVEADVPIPTRIELFCTDKCKLKQFAADIRSKRKPEPYKGKVSHFVVVKLTEF
jgi:large subunit ribosomal protein L6